MRRMGRVVGTVGALWLGAAFAGAQPAGLSEEGVAGGGPGRGKRGPMETLLGLSEEQQASFRAARETQGPELQALHKEIESNRQKLAEALAAESPDPATVGELAIAQHRLIEKQKAIHERTKQALRGMLTAEQQAKLDVLESLRETAGPRGPGAGFFMPAEGPLHERRGAGGFDGPAARTRPPLNRR